MFARHISLLAVAALLFAAANGALAQRPPGTPADPPPSTPSAPQPGPREVPPPAAHTPRDRGPAERQIPPAQPLLRAVAGPSCVFPNGVIILQGEALDAARGLALYLDVPPDRVPVAVIAWQGARAIARLSDDARLSGGRRYRLLLTNQNGRPLAGSPDVFLTLCPTRPAIDVAQAPPPADAAVPDEVTLLVASGSGDPAPLVTALGYAVQQRAQLGAFGQEILRLSVPSDRTVAAAITELRAVLPAATIDANTVYQLQAAPRLYAHRAIGWPQNPLDCVAGGADARLGIIDGPLDDKHPSLAGQDIVRRSFLGDGDLPASADHATGIASLLVGAASPDLEAGLLPAARLYVAEAFGWRPKDSGQTTTFAVALSLNWLGEEAVRVVNLSFAGGKNAVLSAVIEQAHRHGMILVAAAGNNGPQAPPAYPAADGPVIAVTAVDARNNLYAKANRGSYIDFAAPGVDVWTARSGSGGAYRSGTSFAAPFVSAVAAAQLVRTPQLSAGLLVERLRQESRDLGDAYKDTLFGWGLVYGRAICEH